MLFDHRNSSARISRPFKVFGPVLLLVIFARSFCAQESDVAGKLKGFDSYMEQTLKDWNAPGVGVGIVVNDKLVFAKGYGYRDYGQKLPFTPQTLFQIASNSKLFTAVAAGFLVEEGKLSWDKPVRESIPLIQFYNNPLNDNVTLRDMLSHRTGVTRHDSIWFRSSFTRKELFERVKYMEPQQPLRQMLLYNNMMYAAVGYIIELQSGKTWEDFVRERIFSPLGMNTSTFTISEMLKHPDHGVPFDEKRDSFELYQIPYYEDIVGVAPCGAIISNIDELSHWLIAVMNDGKYDGNQVLPPNVLKATLQPAVGLPNSLGEAEGFWEVLNPAAGMGRFTAAYRGHLITYHGGALPGFYSQVSIMPNDKLGVIVFVIGQHSSPLTNVITYNIYERLLGLDQTPWGKRRLEQRLSLKKAGTEARAKAGADRVAGTKPSHDLIDYTGEYEHPAYGILSIEIKDGVLQFKFNRFQFPMSHYHYDRFDTPDDEQYGKFSVNFRTNPQGEIDEAAMSLDEAAIVFARKPPALDPGLLESLSGFYLTPGKVKIQVIYRAGQGLSLNPSGGLPRQLIPVKGLRFRTPQFADEIYEFVVENGQVKALKSRDPAGEYTFTRE